MLMEVRPIMAMTEVGGYQNEDGSGSYYGADGSWGV